MARSYPSLVPDASPLPCAQSTAPTAPGMPDFTILSVNINMGLDLSRRGFVLPRLRDAIRHTGADVVLLQEVMGEHAGLAQRHLDWPSQPQHEYLAESVWPHHAYGRNAVFAGGHQGNAVLSRFPVMAQRNVDVSIAGHEPRGLLHALLEVPGLVAPLHVVSVHLGLRESHRRRQVAQLCALVRDITPGAPLVVGGDFNDWRLCGHGPLLATGMFEAFEAATGRVARSFPAKWPALPLDRIYLRGLRTVELAVLCRAEWSRLSDHAALLARIRANHNGR
jgi:endonuclease/exonuclease/phosphatase family metal-dependent hydrolase